MLRGRTGQEGTDGRLALSHALVDVQKAAMVAVGCSCMHVQYLHALPSMYVGCVSFWQQQAEQAAVGDEIGKQRSCMSAPRTGALDKQATPLMLYACRQGAHRVL